MKSKESRTEYNGTIDRVQEWSKQLQHDRRIGVALGGGAVLGAAHVGVLRALEELDLEISCISGTSIGALIGTLYAFGKTPKEIEEIILDLNWLDISKISLSKYSLLSNEGVGDLLRDELGDVNFGDSRIPLGVLATDIRKGEKVILTDGKVSPAVMASTCIPGVFEPVYHKDRLLVDGGIIENVPVSVSRKMGADLIIAVDLTTAYMETKPENILGVLLSTYYIIFQYQTKIQMSEAEVLIHLDLSDFNLFDPKQVPDLIDRGYSKAKDMFQNSFQ